jgi:hypothetical protein
VQVIVHKKAGATWPAGTFIQVEVYVTKPTPSMTRPPSGSTQIVGTAVSPVLIDAALLTTSGYYVDLPAPSPLEWQVDTSDTHQAAGHKCLIAMCFNSGESPDTSQPFDVADQWTTQHNICVIDCRPDKAVGGGAMRGAAGNNAAGGQGGCALEANAANPNNREPEMVLIRAEADLRPDKAVLNAALPLLQQVPGFQRIATTAPSGFNMQFPEFPNAKVVDNTHPGCLGIVLGLVGAYKPTYEAQFLMGPDQVSPFFFVPDLSRTPRGEAHIFHITHIGANQRLVGGLTVLAVNS